MVAVLVLVVAVFLVMGGVAAIADGLMGERRRRRNEELRRPGSRPGRTRVDGCDVANGGGVAGRTRDERRLLAEIEEWMKQQQQ